MVLIALNDGRCRSCGGQVGVVDADDVTMTVECLNAECADSYPVETDAFNDGGIEYWPRAMAESCEEPWE